MYIRFETNICFRGTQCKKGIFAAMGDLKRSQKMSDEEMTWYKDTAAWFEKNLSYPTCFSPPVPDHIKFRAKSWFAISALEFISKSQEVVCLLRKHGIEVTELYCENPGKPLYKDSLQIVVLSGLEVENA